MMKYKEKSVSHALPAFPSIQLSEDTGVGGARGRQCGTGETASKNRPGPSSIRLHTLSTQPCAQHTMHKQ